MFGWTKKPKGADTLSAKYRIVTHMMDGVEMYLVQYASEAIPGAWRIYPCPLFSEQSQAEKFVEELLKQQAYKPRVVKEYY